MTLLAGRYELGQPLGSGGMAEVHLAFDQVLRRRVAVKIIHPAQLGDPVNRQRFVREAQAAAALQHPNTVAVLAGLQAAHDRGLVHRDVKPSNVLLPAGGGVKLVDFGIATATAGTAAPLPSGENVLGTPRYLAPERISGRRATPASDIYSLGAVTYERLTGQVDLRGRDGRRARRSGAGRAQPAAIAGPRQACDGVPMTTLPSWCTLVRADNPGPMTLDGTNTYVLATSAGNVVVDPGPLLDDHLEAAAALGPVTAVLLTHRHPDHAESSRRFHEMTRAPTLAREPGLCIEADPLSSDGAVLDVPDLRIRVLHTPGHTSDSVCFDVSADGDRALLTGDTILGRGTTVVAYPDGQLGPYLDSLRRLSRLAGVLVLPGHGPVRPDAGTAAADYLAHRQERLDQVRTAVAAGARTAPEVVELVYADVDRRLWPAAELSVRAQLEYLAEGHIGDA